MKPYVLALSLLLTSILRCLANSGDFDSSADYQKIDKAAGIFSIAQGNTASYRLSLLLQNAHASPFGNDLNIFEKYYQKLTAEEQFKLTLLILANYEFEGEYSFRFRLMTSKTKAVVAARLRRIDRRSLEDFLVFYHCKYTEFAKRVADYYGVKLAEKE